MDLGYMAKDRPRGSGTGERHRRVTGLVAISLGLIMALMVVVQPASKASAQIDRVSCGWFATQQEAQEYFEANVEEGSIEETVFDSDGDGIACEAELGGPPVVDPVSCGTFDTQADAQAYLDSGQGDPAIIDPDGDGFACEIQFGEVGEPATEEPVSGRTNTSGSGTSTRLPSTGSGTASSTPDALTAMAMFLALGGGGAAMHSMRLIGRHRA